jgi:hypothetical protein
MKPGVTVRPRVSIRGAGPGERGDVLHRTDREDAVPAHGKRLDRTERGVHGVKGSAGKYEVRLAQEGGAEGTRREGGETAGCGRGGEEAAAAQSRRPAR